MSRIVGVLLLVGPILGGACSVSGSATPTDSPTTTVVTVTTLPAATTETGTASTSSSLPAEGSLPGYTIVSRVEAPEGDTLVVLLDADTYETLTDIDLENVVVDVVERFPPAYEVHVVDSETVVEFVLAQDLDPAATDLLADHYLVRLEQGFRLIYVGQFSDVASSILGS